jgi:fucose permease
MQLTLNSFGCIGASFWMYWRRDSAEALWAGTMLFGAAMASCFPSMMTLAQQYIRLTGRAQGFISVMACMGEVVLPIVVSQLFARLGPPTFMFGVLVMSVSFIVFFVTVNVAGKRTKMAQATDSELHGLLLERDDYDYAGGIN